MIVVEANPDRWGRREQMEGLGGCPGLNLAEQREVAEHPDRAALRRGDQVVAMHEQVARPGGRQVLLERLPVVALPA